MSGLTSQEIMIIVNRWIGVSGGYLGDFSYRTHREFYPEYCGVNYDPDQIQGTTRERFIAILGSALPHDQAKIVSGALERFPLHAENAPRTRTAELRGNLEGIVGRLRSGGGVARPSPRVSSEAVARALSDADTLVGTTDAGNAVDRLHTALHGYLIALCGAAGLEVPAGSSVTGLVKVLREGHPKLQDHGPRASDLRSILKGMSSIVDKLQPVRNDASLAHPNPVLADPEAHLVINAIRTVFHYLDARTGGPEPGSA